jgi:hypothetical protein
MSRIYGGIHLLSENVDGLQVGAGVGRYVVQHELLCPISAGRRPARNPGDDGQSADARVAPGRDTHPTRRRGSGPSPRRRVG